MRFFFGFCNLTAFLFLYQVIFALLSSNIYWNTSKMLLFILITHLKSSRAELANAKMREKWSAIQILNSGLKQIKLARLQPPSFLPFHKEQFILFYFICNEKSMLKVIYHLHLDLLQLSHEITFTIPRYIQDFHFVGQVPQFHFHPTRS